MIVRHRLVFAAAEVAATAATTAAETTAGNGANDDDSLCEKKSPSISFECPGPHTCDRSAHLACRRRDHKVRVHVLLAKLFGNVQTQRAVVVVDVALRLVAEDRVGAVDFLELCGMNGWTELVDWLMVCLSYFEQSLYLCHSVLYQIVKVLITFQLLTLQIEVISNKAYGSLLICSGFILKIFENKYLDH